MERTLAIVKPDAFAAGNAGKILARIYQEGFKVVGIKKLFLSKKQAEGFYAVHRERPFFGELTDFMSRGPCLVMTLEADNAIRRWRDVMGATDPAKAAEGTLRREFGIRYQPLMHHRCIDRARMDGVAADIVFSIAGRNCFREQRDRAFGSNIGESGIQMADQAAYRRRIDDRTAVL